MKLPELPVTEALPRLAAALREGSNAVLGRPARRGQDHARPAAP
jgi:ATP-dependent helicase HrpB